MEPELHLSLVWYPVSFGSKLVADLFECSASNWFLNCWNNCYLYVNYYTRKQSSWVVKEEAEVCGLDSAASRTEIRKFFKT